MEAANVEGGAKIPIPGMGGALVGWWWAHIEECGDGPGRRHSDTQLESVPLYCHQHTSPADIPTLIDWSVSWAHCRLLLFFLANLLKILPSVSYGHSIEAGDDLIRRRVRYGWLGV